MAKNEQDCWCGQAESDFAEAGSLAVVGPNSGLIAYGNYAGRNENNTTPVQGLQRLVPSLVWEEGCAMATNNTSGTQPALHHSLVVMNRQMPNHLMTSDQILTRAHAGRIPRRDRRGQEGEGDASDLRHRQLSGARDGDAQHRDAAWGSGAAAGGAGGDGDEAGAGPHRGQRDGRAQL